MARKTVKAKAVSSEKKVVAGPEKKVVGVEKKREDVTAASFQGGGIEWKTRSDGTAELVVAYQGQLAGRDEVIARAGTWRQGSAPWSDMREFALRRDGQRWVGAIPVGVGAPVEGVEFVFRTGDEWDNGGLAPLGYYEWSPRERRVEIR